jgi:hypothetical protein
MHSLSPWQLFAIARDPRIISFPSFSEEEKLQNILVGGWFKVQGTVRTLTPVIECQRKGSRRGGRADPIAAAGSLWRPGRRDMHFYGEEKEEDGCKGGRRSRVSVRL